MITAIVGKTLVWFLYQ